MPSRSSRMPVRQCTSRDQRPRRWYGFPYPMLCCSPARAEAPPLPNGRTAIDEHCSFGYNAQVGGNTGSGPAEHLWKRSSKVLEGEIGGTKTRLAIFTPHDGHRRPLLEDSCPKARHSDVQAVGGSLSAEAALIGATSLGPCRTKRGSDRPALYRCRFSVQRESPGDLE